MQASDKPRLEAILKYLAGNILLRGGVTPELVESYFNDLADYPIEAVKFAACDMISERSRFPFARDFIPRLAASRKEITATVSG